MSIRNGSGGVSLQGVRRRRGALGVLAIAFAVAVSVLTALPSSAAQSPLFSHRIDITNDLGNAIQSTPEVADFNGDRSPDVAVPYSTGRGDTSPSFIAVYLNNGDGTFPASASATTPLGPTGSLGSPASGDFNHDGIQDLALAIFGLDPAEGCCTPSWIYVLLGVGDGTFGPPTPYSYPAGSTKETANSPGRLFAQDFNGDRRLDLITGNQILVGHGDGTFEPPTALPQLDPGNGTTSWCCETVSLTGDFNADGRPDLLTEARNVYLNRPGGNFAPAIPLPAGPGGSQGGTVGDFNNDGHLDLALLDYTGSDLKASVNIYRGDGTGHFSPPTSHPVFTAPNDAAAGDFDGDGDLDLAVTSSGSPGQINFTAILLNNGDGTFAPMDYIVSQNWPGPVTARDLNGDGRPDLVILASFEVDVFLNVSGGTTTSSTSTTSTSSTSTSTSTSTTSTTRPTTTSSSTSSSTSVPSSTTSTTGPAAASCAGLTATIVGTNGADTIMGTSGPDVIAALGGDDVINSLGGNDTVCGNDGEDTINGGRGNDRLQGNDGDDRLNGQAEDDQLEGGSGHDRIIGGTGRDSLMGNQGSDTLSAKDTPNAADTLNGGPDGDRCLSDPTDTPPSLNGADC